VKITTPEVEIKVEKPRAAIRDFKQAPLSDQECFAKTIARLESDLDLMKVRANAWATGDVAKLRELTHVDNASACIAVVMNAQVMQDRGYTDWPERRMAAWLAAVEAAVARNRSTVTVLSINQILEPDGFVAQLRARGYVVEDP
jgi:TraB/PrgY/gumN family